MLGLRGPRLGDEAGAPKAKEDAIQGRAKSASTPWAFGRSESIRPPSSASAGRQPEGKTCRFRSLQLCRHSRWRCNPVRHWEGTSCFVK